MDRITQRKSVKGKILRKAFWFFWLLVFGWIINVIWYKPFSADVFFERAFFEYSLAHPEGLTEHHAFEKFAFNDFSRKLNDISLDNWERTGGKIKKDYDMLKSYRPKKLSTEDRLSQQILEFYWEMNILLHYDDKDIHLNCIYPVNQVNGVHISFVDFMLNTHEINTLADAENYLDRLSKSKEKLLQARDNLLLHRSPPSFILEKVMIQIGDFLATPPDENLLYNDFLEKVDMINNLPGEARTELFYDMKRILVQDVLPAYQMLQDELKSSLQRQRVLEQAYEEEEGQPYSPSIQRIVAKRVSPDGEEYQKPVGMIYYMNIAKYHMGRHYLEDVIFEDIASEIDDEIYRLKEELSQLLDSAGFPVKDSLLASLTELRLQEEFVYDDSEYGRRMIFQDVQQMIIKANKISQDIYGYKANPLEIGEMVMHRSPYTSRFFYYPSSLDNYRKARLFINFDSLHWLPKYSLPVLVYAYTSPGHHFLKSVQHNNESLPTFRRTMIDFESYSTGWVFYTQRMLEERGIYDSLESRIGYIQWELLEATQLMADYYLHYQEWTREEVIKYVHQNAGIPQWEAEAVVDRVAIEPGRAYAYWEGYKALMRMKEKTKEALKDQFNLREFHQLVLSLGPVPIHILEQEIDRYIAEFTK